MSSARKPWWQKATAVVSLSASGAVTGFTFAPKAAPDLSSPSKMMIHLMALDEAGQPAEVRPGSRDRRCPAALGHRQRRALLPADGGRQDPGRDGSCHLGPRQHRRRESRRVMRGLRQPDPGTGRPGHRRAELGDRRHDLPVAAAQMGRCPGRPEPGFTRDHLRAAGRAGARSLASAQRRLPSAARRLGPVPRARRGGDGLLRRCPAHHRRRLPARLLGECPRVPRLPGRRRGCRRREQRRPGPGWPGSRQQGRRPPGHPSVRDSSSGRPERGGPELGPAPDGPAPGELSLGPARARTPAGLRCRAPVPAPALEPVPAPADRVPTGRAPTGRRRFPVRRLPPATQPPLPAHRLPRLRATPADRPRPATDAVPAPQPRRQETQPSPACLSRSVTAHNITRLSIRSPGARTPSATGRPAGRPHRQHRAVPRLARQSPAAGLLTRAPPTFLASPSRRPATFRPPRRPRRPRRLTAIRATIRHHLPCPRAARPSSKRSSAPWRRGPSPPRASGACPPP